MAAPYPCRLEFSRDDLSVDNASATWIDISPLLKKNTLKWSGGIDALGDAPREGELSFVLGGKHATDFVPLNAASPYYPDVLRRRRFRLSFNRGAGWEPEFLGYARSYRPIWPGNVAEQEVEVACGDGYDLLADPLPALDPPDADSYEDVIDNLEPWGYWRLGEPEGTKVVSRLRKARKKTKRHKARKAKRFRSRVTKAETEGVQGPTGTYKNTPTLGEPGAILGDDDTCVLFEAASSEHALFVLDDTEITVSRNRITLEAWVKPLGAYGVERGIIGGPATAGGDSIWAIYLSTTGKAVMYVATGAALDIATGTTTLGLDVWTHVMGTWDGDKSRVYVDGVLEATTPGGFGTAIVAPAGTSMATGRYWRSGVARYFNGSIDEPVIYEKVLAGSRAADHYLFGTARGYPQQTAGERLEEVCALAPAPWLTAGLAASPFEVLPQMQHGQARIEAIEDAMEAEGDRALLYFDGAGDPHYLGWEFQAAAAYSTVQAEFGAPRQGAELAFEEQDLVHDDQVYNQFTKARLGGEPHTATDAESVALLGYVSEGDVQTDIICASDDDCHMLCQEALTLYAWPSYVVEQLALHGSDEEERLHIFERAIGDMVEFRRRSYDAAGALVLMQDVITWIIGFDKALDGGGNVVCTWRLARGFNGAEEGWLMGITGRSELDLTTVLY